MFNCTYTYTYTHIYKYTQTHTHIYRYAYELVTSFGEVKQLVLDIFKYIYLLTYF